jgi:predicted negative regulator of RcsB-dependent stress response
LGAKKIKVPKKSARTEEAAGYLEGAQQWVLAHLYPLMGVLLGVLFVSVAYVGYNAYQESKEEKAERAYTQVMAEWPSREPAPPEDYQEVAAKLENLMEEHRGTQTAVNAQVDLMQAHLQMEHYNEALELGNELMNRLGSGHDLKMLVRYHLALTCQAVEKWDQALEQWNALKEGESEGLQREVYWHLARIHKARGQHAKAVEAYEKALELSGTYPDGALLEEELSLVRAESETSPPSEESLPDGQENSKS